MSYELVGASGLGTPSSNGSLFGLGAVPSCGMASPNAPGPAGLSPAYQRFYPPGQPTKMACGTGAGGIETLCNLSNNPLFCVVAKRDGKAFLGRGTPADAALWRAWTPAGMRGGDPNGAPPATDNTTLYVGIGVGALALGAIAYKMSKKSH